MNALRHPDMKRNERTVTNEELEALWADLKAKGILYNGMTHHALVERYGDRVRHIMGYGWVKR